MCCTAKCLKKTHPNYAYNKQNCPKPKPPTVPSPTPKPKAPTPNPIQTFPPPPALPFVHPGVFVSKNQLDFVKGRISAGQEPWANAFAVFKQHAFASLTYTPHPRDIVNCGPNNIPDEGCEDEIFDNTAAWAHALMWSYTGNIAHAQKAVEILDAWSAVLVNHTGANAVLMIAWSGEMFVRAAEIIRHTTPAGTWAPANILRFEAMLRTYVPRLWNGKPIYTGGNWELSMGDALINIGVFLSDHPIYFRGVELWRRRVPAYIYLKTDGAMPVRPPQFGPNYLSDQNLVVFWNYQKIFENGLAQETCRDIAHVSMGLTSIAHAAETARIQGLDLYGMEESRIIAGVEFHTNLFAGSRPGWLCNGTIQTLGVVPVTFEVAYNHYALRRGLPMPITDAYLKSIRPTGMWTIGAWETLTHGLTGLAA